MEKAQHRSAGRQKASDVNRPERDRIVISEQFLGQRAVERVERVQRHQYHRESTATDELEEVRGGEWNRFRHSSAMMPASA